MIEYECPHCGHNLSIPEKYAGQAGKCNYCNERLVVPKFEAQDGQRELSWTTHSLADFTMPWPNGWTQISNHPFVVAPEDNRLVDGIYSLSINVLMARLPPEATIMAQYGSITSMIEQYEDAVRADLSGSNSLQSLWTTTGPNNNTALFTDFTYRSNRFRSRVLTTFISGTMFRFEFGGLKEESEEFQDESILKFLRAFAPA